MNMLFVCTGNSCRSQMAEGWAKALAPDCEINSAGFTGPEEEVRAGFDRVCLEIRAGVKKLLAETARYAIE